MEKGGVNWRKGNLKMFFVCFESGERGGRITVCTNECKVADSNYGTKVVGKGREGKG